MPQTDPFELPEWRAIHREAALVSQLIGSGVTAIGRATYSSGMGEYYTAFFGLSIGIERLSKLILVADYALNNAGSLPDRNTTRKFGHKLSELTEAIDEISERRQLKLRFSTPRDQISKAALECLDAFADASKGRYANFEVIGNLNFKSEDEPIARWWLHVVKPILNKHYHGSRAEAGVKTNASIADLMLGNNTNVRFVDESGDTMLDIGTASERTGQTQWAQKYGRFYILTTVRWLSEIFDLLIHKAAYEESIASMLGHNEFFYHYLNDDSFLLSRKRWTPFR